jgi:hypothetical protein
LLLNTLRSQVGLHGTKLVFLRNPDLLRRVNKAAAVVAGDGHELDGAENHEIVVKSPPLSGSIVSAVPVQSGLTRYVPVKVPRAAPPAGSVVLIVRVPEVTRPFPSKVIRPVCA